MEPRDDLLLSKVSINRLATRSTVPDQESLPTIDQIPTARASVAMLDKLWTQIDVLDDVKAMAETVGKHGSFFTDEFTQSLRSMKESQEKLLDKVEAHQIACNKAREEQEKLFTYNANQPSETSQEEEEHELIKKRMDEFFSLPPKPTTEDSKLKDFDELDQYVNEVRSNLRDVLEQMKNFDDVRRKLW